MLVGMQDNTVIELSEQEVEDEEDSYVHDGSGASMDRVGNEGQYDEVDVIEEAENSCQYRAGH